MTTKLDRHAELSLEPQLDSAAAARRFVRTLLQEWDASELVEDALLAVSELVTNAIIHARSIIDLRLDLDDERLRVEVRDRSARPVLLDSVVAGVADEPTTDAGSTRPVATQPRLEAETSTGRGLFIVAAMAVAVGEHVDAAGKTVWFELERRSSRDGSTVVVQARRVVHDDEVVAVRLVGLVPAIVIAADEHMNDLLRELPQVHGDGEAEAAALVECAQEIVRSHPDVERIADSARVAAARGRERFDVSLELSVHASEQVTRLYDLAIRAQRLCTSGIVLTLPATDTVLDFWNWLSQELQRQLVRSQPPTPYPDADPD